MPANLIDKYLGNESVQSEQYEEEFSESLYSDRKRP